MILLKKIISYAIPTVVIPLAVMLGALIFRDRMYVWIAVCVAIMACIPFFLAFEKGSASSKRLTLVAVLTSLGIVGRLVFAVVPHFKPVAALTQITGMFLGAHCGFICGALSALISNFAFGQGPWTPFQMLSWGLTGFFGGVFSRLLKHSRVAAYIYGALSGVVYSLILDVWSVLLYGGEAGSEMISLLIASAPVMLIYAVSNVVFLALFIRPIGEKIERIKLKYGIELPEEDR
ncbi:MAG: ECF transporter S component [Clostridia bacterium]|nr:ECF transporter S component [Clostridia bacterium]